MIKVGDIVSRYKYNNDTLFKVEKIEDNIYYLSGIEVRLCADSMEDDLKKEELPITQDDDRLAQILNEDEYRDDYFYIPGRILHIDGDKEYLKRCLKFYKKVGLNAYGLYEKEEDLYKNIIRYLKQ